MKPFLSSIVLVSVLVFANVVRSEPPVSNNGGGGGWGQQQQQQQQSGGWGNSQQQSGGYSGGQSSGGYSGGQSSGGGWGQQQTQQQDGRNGGGWMQQSVQVQSGGGNGGGGWGQQAQTQQSGGGGGGWGSNDQSQMQKDQGSGNGWGSQLNFEVDSNNLKNFSPGKFFRSIIGIPRKIISFLRESGLYILFIPLLVILPLLLLAFNFGRLIGGLNWGWGKRSMSTVESGILGYLKSPAWQKVAETVMDEHVFERIMKSLEEFKKDW